MSDFKYYISIIYVVISMSSLITSNLVYWHFFKFTKIKKNPSIEPIKIIIPVITNLVIYLTLYYIPDNLYLYTCYILYSIATAMYFNPFNTVSNVNNNKSEVVDKYWFNISKLLSLKNTNRILFVPTNIIIIFNSILFLNRKKSSITTDILGCISNISYTLFLFWYDYSGVMHDIFTYVSMFSTISVCALLQPDNSSGIVTMAMCVLIYLVLTIIRRCIIYYYKLVYSINIENNKLLSYFFGLVLSNLQYMIVISVQYNILNIDN